MASLCFLRYGVNIKCVKPHLSVSKFIPIRKIVLLRLCKNAAAPSIPPGHSNRALVKSALNLAAAVFVYPLTAQLFRILLMLLIIDLLRMSSAYRRSTASLFQNRRLPFLQSQNTGGYFYLFLMLRQCRIQTKYR